MRKLPEYAQGQGGELIMAMCKGGCRTTRVHRLNPGQGMEPEAKDQKYAGCSATCLSCGKEAYDNYNWFGSAWGTYARPR